MAQDPQLAAATVFKDALESKFDPTLARTRQTRLRELQRNLDMQAQDQQRSQQTGRPRTFFSAAMPSDVTNLQEDITNDPFTGQDAQDRTARVQTQLDAAGMTQRPEIADAAETVAKRNAFADFLKAQSGEAGKFAAQTAPGGVDALDAASRRKIAENEAGFKSRIDMANVLSGQKSADKGLSAEGTKSAVALHQAVDLGGKLHRLLTEQLQANPQAARESGVLGQVGDMVQAPFKRWLYTKGALQSPVGYDESTQLADWMKVLATRGLMGGVRNMAWIEQIQDHLAAGRLPPAASLQRLEQFLKQAPDLENDIYAVEKEKQRLAPNPDQSDIITDPNWGQ